MEPISTFQKYLKSRDLKCTPERKEILRLILSMNGRHFEADDLLVKLRHKKSRVAKATIYRTLKHLVDAHILRSVIFVDRHAHYELVAGGKHHSHLVCLKCGRVIEFSSPRIQEELTSAGKKFNFDKTSHKVEITGFCRKCR